MSDMMNFPKTWEEYEKLYGFNDSEEIYTNNSRLIPSFRVKQWLDHLPSGQPDKDLIHLQKEQAYMQGYEDGRKSRKGKWIYKHFVWFCSKCGENPTKGMGYVQGHQELYDFCPKCGAEMRQREDDNV